MIVGVVSLVVLKSCKAVNDMTVSWFLFLFFVQFTVEVLFVSYLYLVEARKVLMASSLRVVCWMMYALVVVSFVNDKWNLIPLSLGVFAGTAVVVQIKRYREKRSTNASTSSI